MMNKEIQNGRELIRLLDSGVEFMATTDKGETPLMHGTNLRALLQTRIALMERHLNDEPYIDHHYTEKMAGRLLDGE
jgi:hypothetical protein